MSQVMSAGVETIGSRFARDVAGTSCTYPSYDRTSLGCGIAHIGLGNFHRSHQAFFLHRYLQSNSEDWMVHGISCLASSADLVESINAQDNLYTLTERSASSATLHVIGSIKNVTHALFEPDVVSDVLASSDIKIITLTVTAAGYCTDSLGDIDVNNSLIERDLGNVPPVSAAGLIFAAAKTRMENNGEPFTVVSCDNLPQNGRLIERVVLQFADLKDPEVREWIGANVTFPNSVVDRITPTQNDETTRLINTSFDLDDACPVVSEPYAQWVVEDNFVNGRPDLEETGVIFTDDVEPFEELKLRLVDSSQTVLSFAAYMMGFRDVDDAMSDVAVREYLWRYLDEEAAPSGGNAHAASVALYKSSLLARLRNPAIRHELVVLTANGSQKIRDSVVPVLRHQLITGGSIRWTAFALAAWCRYLRGVDEHGHVIPIDDSLRDVLIARSDMEPNDPTHLLAMREIFDRRVAGDERLIDAVKKSLNDINRLGTHRTLREMLTTE